MSIFDDEIQDDIDVVAPSGGKFKVMTQDEADYFNDIANRYTLQNKFTNIADMQDLDRILVMETMCWRWGLWLSQERDYVGNPVNLEEVKKSLVDYSRELRLLKKTLGIDKTSRDKDKGESIAAYLDDLRYRAQEFGIMRENQLSVGITLFQELIALITLYKNCTPDERKENGVELNDVFNWIDQVAIPEFQEVDKHFREHSQKFWIKKI